MFSNSAAIYTAAGGKTIIWFFCYNIAATQYAAIFLNDGTAIQVNLVTAATTTISATPNTFYNGGDLPGATQMGSAGIIIVTTASSNGYYAWDGTTLFSPGGFAPGWLSGQTLAITLVGDTHSNTTIDNIVSTTGVVNGMGITGTGIPANDTIASHTGTTITLVSAATATNSSVTFTINFIMPTGVQGTAVEVYQSRIWIDNGTTKLFSAPSNGARFDASLGGGAITATDSFLRRIFVISKQLSSFLYSLGDSSINVISNVQTSGSPPLTTFNNQNVDAQVGTIWPGTVHPYGRGLMFANPTGVYALYGGAAEKVSTQLDGIFATADFTMHPSGGSVTLNGVRVYFILIKGTDYLGNVRPFMCIWNGTKWWIGSQAKTGLTYVDTQEINSVLKAYGTDGASFFQMFTTASASISKVIQTRLWVGDSYLITKQAMRLFSLGTDFSGAGYGFSGTLDLLVESLGPKQTAVSLSSPPQKIQWINNLGQQVNFVNNSAAALIWVGSGATLGLLGENITGSGALMGLTLASSSTDFSLASLTVVYRRQAPVGG